MNTKKILESEIASLKVASLPSRPTAPTAFGGKGYTATQMKEAFDKLPLYIIQRLNSLLDDIVAEGEGSLAASVPTGLSELHTLAELFEDIPNGSFSTYLAVGDESLAAVKERQDATLDELSQTVASILQTLSDPIISGGTPATRAAFESEVAAE